MDLKLLKKIGGGIYPEKTGVAKLLEALNRTLDLKNIYDVSVVEHYSSKEIVITYADATTKTIII